MAALPYMQLYVADYLADTMHLTVEEHGAYLLLIMNYWQTGKPIKQKRIQAITRINNERLTDVTETLQEFFNVDDSGVWHHSRIEADLKKVKSKSIKASEAGKKSALKRWGNNKKVTDVTTDVTETLQPKNNHTEADTNTDTNTDIKEKDKKKKPRSKFSPPSVIEIQNLATEENLNLIGFFDYYESNGWLVGKNKMKSWQAAARGWSKRQIEFNNQGQNNGNNRQLSNQESHATASGILSEQLRESVAAEMG